MMVQPIRSSRATRCNRAAHLALLAGLATASFASGQVIDAQWLLPASGHWFDAANWSSPVAPNNGTPPGAEYRAIFSMPGAYTVDVLAWARVNAVVMNATNATLRLGAGGTLETTGGLDLQDGYLRLDGGTLIGSVTATSGRISASSDAANTFYGVTLNGLVNFDDNNATVRVVNGMSVSGTLKMNWFTQSFVFDGNQSLSGGGTVSVLAPDSALSITNGSTLTVGSGTSVIGNGFIGRPVSGSATLVNAGTIDASTNGGTMNLAATSTINNGTLGASNLGTLNIAQGALTNNGSLRARTGGIIKLDLGASTFVNTGTINLAGGTLLIKGLSPTTNLGAFSRDAASIVAFEGFYDNTGKTFGTDIGGGPWALEAPTAVTRANTRIFGGTIAPTGAGELQFWLQGGTLDSVATSGAITLRNAPNGGVARLQGPIALGGPLRTALNTTELAAGMSLSGDVLEGVPSGNGNPQIISLGTATIQSNSGMRAAPGAAMWLMGNGGYANAGTIGADGAGSSLEIRSKTFTNTGTLQAINGGTLAIEDAVASSSFSSTGIIHIDGASRLKIDRNTTLATLGTLVLDSGSATTLSRTLTLTGSTFTVPSGASFKLINNGTIKGGTLVALQPLTIVDTSSSTTAFGTMDGVAVQGTIVVPTGGWLNAFTSLSGGTYLVNGTMATPGGTLSVQNADLTFGPGSLFSMNATNNTVTFAASTTIRGKGGAIGGTTSGVTSAALTCNGRVVVEDAGTSLAIGGITSAFNGSLEVRNGSTLSASASQSGTIGGSIVIDNATLRIGGPTSGSTGGMKILPSATWSRTGGQVQLFGRIDNAGQTLVLDHTTGDFGFFNSNVGTTLANGAIELREGAKLLIPKRGISGNNPIAFENTKLTGDLDLTSTVNVGTTSQFELVGTATMFSSIFNAQSSVGPGSTSLVGGTYLLDGTSSTSVVNTAIETGTSTTLTLSPTTLVRGGGSSQGLVAPPRTYIGTNSSASSPNGVINRGIVRADVSGREIAIWSAQVSNQGLCEAKDGGVLRLFSMNALQNTGIIRATNGGQIWLQGKVATASLGTLDTAGGELWSNALWDNTGQTLSLTSQTGSLSLFDGTRIDGGSIVPSASARLRVRSGDVRLASVSVQGDLWIEGGNVSSFEGTTVQGAITLSGNGAIGFGTMTPTLNSSINFQNDAATPGVIAANSRVNPLSSLVLGASSIVRGGNGVLFTNATGQITNNGLISADRAGTSITIYLEQFINNGTIEAINDGSIVFVSPPGSLLPSVLVTLNNTMNVSGSSRVSIAGSFLGKPSGTLSFVLSGARSIPALDVSGSFTESGTLAIALADGYIPSVGTSFVLFRGGSVSGQFGSVNLPSLPGSLSWDTSQLAQGRLSVVPAPGTAALMSLLLGVGAGRARRRR